jgi:TonB family protein
MSDSARLAANQGIIVYRMTCGPGVAWGQIFRSGESLKGSKAESRRAGILSCREPGVQTQRLAAGRYFVGKIGYQAVVDFDEQVAMQFEVAAGQAHYIGHISLPSSTDTGKLLIGDPFVSDWHDELQMWIASKPVALHGQHELITALAQAPSKLIANLPEELSARAGATELTVVLKLRVAENGSVKEGHIARSSGNTHLDDTALMDAVRNWQVTPATQGGAAIEKWGNYSITYRRAY